MNTVAYPPAGPFPAPTIDVVDLLKGIFCRRLLLLAVFASIFLAALAVAFLATPRYSAESQVLIENLETVFTRSRIEADRRLLDEREVTSQLQIFQSRMLAERVVEALHLDQRSEFDPARGGLAPWREVAVTLGLAADPRRQPPARRAVASYLSKLTVYAVPTSNVIVVRMTSQDPQTAAEAANTHAENYVSATRELQSRLTTEARDWLAEQIDRLRNKVIDSEGAVEDFRSRSGLVQGSGATLDTQELSELNTQITQAAAARAEAQTKASAIRELLPRSSPR